MSLIVPSAKWDARFLRLAAEVGSWSKDPSTKVGCVIVGPDREIRSTGYNGPPRGIDDAVEARWRRPEKYLWVIHAEANAVAHAARIGVSLKGCTVYSTFFPCATCAGLLVQAGVAAVVAPAAGAARSEADDRWELSHSAARAMFEEAGIEWEVV